MDSAVSVQNNALRADGADTTRRTFLKRGLIAAGGLTATLALASRASADEDEDPTFAIQRDYLTGQYRSAFRSIQRHENDHRAFLISALGTAARPRPTFQNLELSDINDFIALSRDFENTGASAYLFAAPFLFNRQYIAQAGSIALIEARQAGILENLTGGTTSQFDASFEAARSPEQVTAGVSKFIASLNGGPAPTFRQETAAANDIAILNFALLLEYLESDFYNINVPKFFP